MPRRAFTSVTASCTFAGLRSEPVLYWDMCFAPTLARQSSELPIGRSYVVDSDPDHRGANDIVLLGSRNSAANGGVKLPYVVSAYVRPPLNERCSTGGAHAKSRSTPCEVTLGIDTTTKLMPVKVLSWKSSNF